MRKNAFICIMTLALISLSVIACKYPDADSGVLSETQKYPTAMLGEWIRMDNGDTWYIAKNFILVNNRNTTLKGTLTRQSDRVMKVGDKSGDDEKDYYLYASRIANASFTGKVVSLGTSANSQAPKSINISEIVKNVFIADENSGTTNTVKTDNNGNFTTSDTIPGDTYTVTPDGGSPTEVSPQGDGDDVGTITVTKGVNFKTSIAGASSDLDMTRLYADSTEYDFTITTTNTGTEDATAATYSLDIPAALTVDSGSDPSTGRFGTIEPGKTKTISLNLSCAQVSGEYEYKKIGITINDPINNKTWTDSVSLKFNKAPVTFYINSNSAVSGIIIAPTALTYSFKTQSSYGGLYSASVKVPWSTKDYLVVFSGATADTEAVYSLGIGVAADSNAGDFSSFINTGNYESNNTEDSATKLDTGGQIMSYLDKNDVDYYDVNIKSMY
jgi:hypothetical protein